MAVSRTDGEIKAIFGNPVTIEAHEEGIPDNGKPFPDGSVIVKIHWNKGPKSASPYAVEIPKTLPSVSFISPINRYNPANAMPCQRRRRPLHSSSPGRCLVPQNEWSLERDERSCVVRNEARRVVSKGAARRNGSTVVEGACRFVHALATIHNERDCALVFLRICVEFDSDGIGIEIVKQNLNVK